MTHDEGTVAATEGRRHASSAAVNSLHLLVLDHLDQGLLAVERAAAMVTDGADAKPGRDRRRRLRALDKQFKVLRQQMDQIALAVVDLGLTAPAPKTAAGTRPKLTLVACHDSLPQDRPSGRPALRLCGAPGGQERA